MHCPFCGAPGRWVLRLSPVHLLLSLCTLGLWLWVEPPARRRCHACGASLAEAARRLRIFADILRPAGPA
jgi:hypothetical protein